jgi:hypothetical protein
VAWSWAAAKLVALTQLAHEGRERPLIDLDRVRALAAGLNSRRWRDPDRYCSLLEPDHGRAVRREKPLADEWP